MPQTPAYKRILLKLSGEALMGEDNYGITARRSTASWVRSPKSCGPRRGGGGRHWRW